MRNLLTAGCLGLALIAAQPAIAGQPFTIERVDVNPLTGLQADGLSDSPVLSADGCVVAFVSKSGTLAPASYGLTTNSPAQVYVRDRCASPETLTLVSVTDDGTAAADEDCMHPTLSSDGRYVAFVTTAGNLPVPGSAPSGRGWFVFLRDRLANATVSPLEAWRVTASTIAGVGEVNLLHHYMSADATRMALSFSNSVTVPSDLYWMDIAAGAGTLHAVCPPAAVAANQGCRQAQISGDGGTVNVYTPYPLVPGDTNGVDDVYSYTIATGATTIVSVNADGSQANGDVFPYGDSAVSADGTFVAFSTVEATNLAGAPPNAIVIKNTVTGNLAIASITNGGTPESIGVGTAAPGLSADGSRIAFTSDNPDLSPGGPTSAKDTLVRDMALGRLISTCRASSGTHGRAGCDGVEISADGKWSAFRSNSDNLVPDDTNELPDIFVVALDPIFDDVFADGFEP